MRNHYMTDLRVCCRNYGQPTGFPASGGVFTKVTFAQLRCMTVQPCELFLHVLLLCLFIPIHCSLLQTVMAFNSSTCYGTDSFPLYIYICKQTGRRSLFSSLKHWPARLSILTSTTVFLEALTQGCLSLSMSHRVCY